MNEWETITIGQDIILRRARWWQFWVPHYKPISLRLSMNVKGSGSLHGVRIECKESKMNSKYRLLWVVQILGIILILGAVIGLASWVWT